jgi:hypothetical protein
MRKVVAAVAVALVLTGCATSPADDVAQVWGELSDEGHALMCSGADAGNASGAAASIAALAYRDPDNTRPYSESEYAALLVEAMGRYC